jgi:hypothetical protein
LALLDGIGDLGSEGILDGHEADEGQLLLDAGTFLAVALGREVRMGRRGWEGRRGERLERERMEKERERLESERLEKKERERMERRRRHTQY